jgi:hypothetical protein
MAKFAAGAWRPPVWIEPGDAGAVGVETSEAIAADADPDGAGAGTGVDGAAADADGASARKRDGFDPGEVPARSGKPDGCDCCRDPPESESSPDSGSCAVEARSASVFGVRATVTAGGRVGFGVGVVWTPEAEKSRPAGAWNWAGAGGLAGSAADSARAGLKAGIGDAAGADGSEGAAYPGRA